MPILFFSRPKKKSGESNPEPRGRTILHELFTGKRRNEVRGIAWWAAGLLLGAAFWPHGAGHDALGPTGEILFRLGFAAAGVLIFLLPFLVAGFGTLVFAGRTIENQPYKMLGLGMAALSALVLVHLIHPQPLLLMPVRSFYAAQGLREFWDSLPRGLRFWGYAELPLSGLPARWLAEWLIRIFSVTGTYIGCGTVLVLSLYFLEVEARVLGALNRVFSGVRKLSQPAASSPLQYAAAKPAPAKPAPRSLEKMPPAEPPKIKITSPAPPAEPKLRIPAAKARLDPEEAGDSPATEKTFQLPELDLLTDPKPNATMSTAYFEGMSQTLENVLAQFGVSAKVVEVCPGPVVTRYELQPAPGVKVNRILSLADDIALGMKAEHVRIEAPIPGKGAVGIEIPNAQKQIVVLKELLSNPAFRTEDSILNFSVGKDIGGQHVFAQLEKMPHLLIAGATGSGKSACINSILCSLLYRATPRELRLLLIDPKRVELTMYNGIPHLKAPVITDSQQASVALKLLVQEMEERYKLFAQLGVRDILSYNQRVAKSSEPQPGDPQAQDPMPYIVVFIDELADLMMVAANEVENAITRLAQMARGVGIHLVLATQRPSVDVITGVIKANFPSRIAFQVSSKVDSRTILDANGADALLGRGDMLYSPASATKPLRVQGVFVTTAEVERLAGFWKSQGAPVFDPAFADSKLKSGGESGRDDGEEDEFYSEAVSWVVRAKQASTSLLQRRLKIGYSRAARLLDMMEERGVVGPPEGSKPRKVLVDTAALDFVAEADNVLEGSRHEE